MPITRTPMIDDDGSGTTGTIINNAWKTELYNQIDGALGIWTPYTPAFGASTAPALGNGLLDGRYMVIGRSVYFKLRFLPGSTTTFGTGAFYFGFPINAATIYLGAFPANLLQSGVRTWQGMGQVYTPTAFRLLIDQDYASSAWPWAWKANDYLYVDGFYEMA